MIKFKQPNLNPFKPIRVLAFLSAMAFAPFLSSAGTPPNTNGKEKLSPKREIIVWCEVRGIYSRYTGYDGVLTHVCSFVSVNEICYYVPCGVMEAEILPKMKPAFQPPVSIEQTGNDFYLLVPNKNGYEVIPMRNPIIKVNDKSIIIM